MQSTLCLHVIRRTVVPCETPRPQRLVAVGMGAWARLSGTSSLKPKSRKELAWSGAWLALVTSVPVPKP